MFTKLLWIFYNKLKPVQEKVKVGINVNWDYFMIESKEVFTSGKILKYKKLKLLNKNGFLYD
jgi:hypothetical protein